MRHGSAMVDEEAAEFGPVQGVSDWPDAATLGRRLLRAACEACAMHADLARPGADDHLPASPLGVPSLADLLESPR